jgi:ligand-binding sensor domain-containing protein
MLSFGLLPVTTNSMTFFIFVTSIIPSDPNLELNITIPDYYQYLYIIRNDMGVYTSQIIPIENNKAVFGGMKSVNDDPVDVIYGVNAQGDVAFDANGVFFMATKSGLYRCDPAG